MDEKQMTTPREQDTNLAEPTQPTIDSDDRRLGRAQISRYIRDFLGRCGLLYAGRSDFSELQSACIAKSIARGYITPENDSFRRLIPVGVAVVWNAYHHLPDQQTQEYLALLISFFVGAEDVFKNNNDAILAFNGLFIRRQPQKHPMLDHLADLLLDVPSQFPTAAVNMMITSALNFMTAVCLENDFIGFNPAPTAPHYPAFIRRMSGFSELLGFFVFTPDVPLEISLPVLPDLMTFLCYANDVLSFYKEELANEEENLVYTLARCRRVHPSDALREVIEDAVAAHHRVLETLKPHSVAFDCYKQFSQGYIGFHVASKRYRLDELQG